MSSAGGRTLSCGAGRHQRRTPSSNPSKLKRLQKGQTHPEQASIATIGPTPRQTIIDQIPRDQHGLMSCWLRTKRGASVHEPQRSTVHRLTADGEQTSALHPEQRTTGAKQDDAGPCPPNRSPVPPPSNLPHQPHTCSPAGVSDADSKNIQRPALGRLASEGTVHVPGMHASTRMDEHLTGIGPTPTACREEEA